MFIVYGTKYKLRIKILKLNNKTQICFIYLWFNDIQRWIKITIMIIFYFYNYIILWTLSNYVPIFESFLCIHFIIMFRDQITNNN